MPNSFERLDKTKRIYILHPYLAERLDVLHDWIVKGAHYWRLKGTKLTQADLESQWQTAGDDTAQWLIIDEVDRADDCALACFLSLRVAQQAETRFLLMGRTVPMCVVRGELAAWTQVFPHEPEQLMLDYSQELPRHTQGRHLLEVYALNGGQVVLDGATIETWDGLLPRLLFYFLVDRGIATRDSIFDNFWQDAATPEATNVFHVTKRKINEMLGIELVVYDGGFYRFSPDIDLNYDVLSFMQNAQVGDLAEDDAQAEVALEAALRIYRGDFLSGYKAQWIESRRYELGQSYCEALSRLAELRERQGKLKDAVGLYLRSMRFDNADNGIWRRVVGLYERLGDERGAEAVQRAFAKASTN